MDPVTALTVTVDSDADGTPVVVLAGQLDLATASTAEDAFATLPAPGAGHPDGNGHRPATPDVVVDMTELTFMDSSGLTVLLQAVNRGYAVRLRRPGHLIQRIIAASGLRETLPVEP